MERVYTYRGSSLIELLVAVSILLAILGGFASTLIASMHSVTSSATTASSEREVQKIFDELRGTSYFKVLEKFSEDPGVIEDGDRIVFAEMSDPECRCSYTTYLTALRAGSSSIPDGLHVRVEVNRRRGFFGSTVSTFETILTFVRN